MAQSLARRAPVVEFAPRTPAPAKGGDQQLALGLVAHEGPNLSAADRIEAERRYGVIEPLVNPDRYPDLRDWSKAAVHEFLAKQHKVGVRSVYRWHTAFRTGGLPALVAKDRCDKGKPKKFGQADLELITRAALPEKGTSGLLTVADIYRHHTEEREWRDDHVGKRLDSFARAKYARYIDEDGKLRESARLTKATYETFRVWFNRIPEAVKLLARDGEEAFRNQAEMLSHRAYDMQPLDYLVMDHRRLDVFCLFPARGGWKLARPWLTAAIDMRTRKWLGWVIVETPSSDSIAAVLKQVFMRWGLPRECYWDNGKDFRCQWFEGREERSVDGKTGELGTAWRGVMETLGIRVRHAIAYNARAKMIEPNFGRISDFDRTLPEWCGHRPDARPEVFGSLVRQHEAWAAGERGETPFRTVNEIAELYGKAIEDLNERPVQGEGMNKITHQGRGWMCPNEAWEKLIGRVELRRPPLDVLQFCFAKTKRLTVRNSEVSMTFGGRPYRYRIQGEALALGYFHGREVDVRYDPLDLGEVVVYHESRLVGLAHCVQLRRMGEDAFVEDERNRRALRKDIKSLISAVHRQVPLADPTERLERRRAVTPARIEPDRAIAAAPVPAEIEEAAAQARADKAFRFAEVAPNVDVKDAPVESTDDEFNFFRGTEMVRQVSDEEIAVVRAEIKQLLSVRPDLTATDIAQYTDLTAPTVRSWICGNMPGGHHVIGQMRRVLEMARAGEIFQPGGGGAVALSTDPDAKVRKPKAGRIYETEMFRNVGKVMDYCVENAAIGVVTAHFGAGKTESVKAWRRAHRDVDCTVIEFDEFTRTNKVHFIRRLGRAYGITRDVGSMNGGLVYEELIEKIREQPGLLIFDQCETVRPLICQIIRQLWDRTADAGVGVVLLGAPVLMQRLLASNIADLEALASRVGIYAPLSGLTKTEMASILKHEGITEVDESAFALWFRMTNGSMRRLMKSIDLLRSRHGGKKITDRTIAGVAGHLWGLSVHTEGE